MKKFISVILCVLIACAALIGCGLINHNYERDYRQVIATIDSFTQTVKGEKIDLDSNGMPKLDLEGEVLTVPVETTYTSEKVTIYKSQLVNYANYYLNQYLNQGDTIQASVDKFMDMLIASELLIIEADKLFDAGILYWTESDIENIQRSVYTAISDDIFAQKNVLLKADGQPELPAKGGDPSTGETTYPVKPEEAVVADFSPAVITENDGSYQWFDSWYTDGEWYIEGVNFKNTYPGMFSGSLKDKSLSIEAFSAYLDRIIENSKNIIGVTDAQREIIDGEIAAINRVRANLGVSYVYPLLGKTLMLKLTVGNQYIKSQKLTKLQSYITEDMTVVEAADVLEYYNAQIKSQKQRFATVSNYDSAISGKENIVYTPSNRHVFVKHILLPFSDAQTAQLNRYKAIYGTNTDMIETLRANLAKQITVYKHVNGEDDTSRKYTVDDVTSLVIKNVGKFENNAREAERAFDDLIYEFNTDPGIFGSEKGYAVVYDLSINGDTEQYMTEFAEAAREFRRNSRYSVGNIYYDEETGAPYIITDYGIHIMYYALDPQEGTIGMNEYVTPAGYNKVADLMRSAVLEQAKADTYSSWEASYLKANRDVYANVKTDLVETYVKELNKQIYGA